MKRYYLDHNATTPLDPGVRRAMEPYLELVGNPSSLHAEGRHIRAGIDIARDRIAEILGVKASEVVFTAGGTESNNLALLGLALAPTARGKHVVTSAVEHQAVLEACHYLASRFGFRLTLLPVDSAGRVEPEQLRDVLKEETTLVSIMSANNETGVRQPIDALASLCAEREVPFHTDAVQVAGHETLNLKHSAITALSLTAHKFYGPVGAGLLIVRAGQALRSLHHGGSQENSRRPGTENAAAIVGLAEALALAQELGPQEAPRLSELVEQLWAGLSDLPGIQRNGAGAERMPNTLNVSFDGLDGEELLMGLDLAGLAVSSGSACLVGSVQASHVLQAMGVPDRVARATVRFSLGRSSQLEDGPEIIHRVRQVVALQRSVHSA